MIPAAFRAFSDVLSPAFRTVLLKAVGLSLVLFVAVFLGVQGAIMVFVGLPWPWLDTVVQVVAGLGLLAAFFFLMSPVTALFAGLYLDEIAGLVETRHYPGDRPGVPLNTVTALLTGLQFAGLVLLVNLVVLPTVFLGIGVLVILTANAYLLGREYFELIAMRHLPVADARRLRRENRLHLWTAGFVPAAWALVPFVNLAVPLFATAYFVHIFKRLAPRA
ncbi:MAG: sulfate transporter family protein [Parvibaculaceae bacterium]